MSRFLVYFSKTGDLSPSALRQVKFGQCILKLLESTDHHIRLACHVQSDKLILTKLTPKLGSEWIPALIQHSPVCPFACMPEEKLETIPDDILNRGVAAGVSVLLSTRDKHLILTRRAEHMRTFPGMWVPPGGHIEIGETLSEAGFRELREETGLDVSENGTIPLVSTHLLCLWESAYPPLYSDDSPPKRQHVVVYLVANSSKTWREIQPFIKLDPSETAACVWLNEQLIDTIVGGKKSKKYEKMDDDSLLLTAVSPDGSQDTLPLDPALLDALGGVSSPYLTSGSRFALAQWLMAEDKLVDSKI